MTSALVPGTHVDGVVRADQRAQHGHQVGGALVVEAVDLRHDLPARRAAGAALGHAHAAALQLGVGLGHHLVQAAGLHHRKALQAQRRQELVKRLGRRHGVFGDEVDLPAHARVHHHVAPGDGGHGARHGLDLGVGEVQRHRLAGAHAGGAGLQHVLSMNLACSAHE
jgi:hypothetical protein